MFMLSCAKNTKDEGYIIVATSATFPPFTYIDEDSGTIVGFEIEIAKEIAHDMGKTLKVQGMDFTKMIPALQSGEIDMIISSMTITDERKLIIDFSNSYYETPQIIIVRKDDSSFENVYSIKQIGSDTKIASMLGTTGVTIAKNIVDSSSVWELSSWDVMVGELLSENIDAVIIDVGSVQKYLSHYDNISVLPVNLETEHYGIAVKKGDKKLLDLINATLSRLLNSGQYARLVEQHITSYSVE